MNHHGQIMNLAAKPYDGTDAYNHYCRGHRDARHEAAEIACNADKEIESLKDTLKRIALNISGDLPAQVIAGNALPREQP